MVDEEIVKYILEEWKNNSIDNSEAKILKAKSDFLRNKFRTEIENLKYGTMQDFLKYYVQ